VARSAIARDAVGALDVGGAASDTAQRPLDQCDCFDRLRPPGSSKLVSGVHQEENAVSFSADHAGNIVTGNGPHDSLGEILSVKRTRSARSELVSVLASFFACLECLGHKRCELGETGHDASRY